MRATRRRARKGVHVFEVSGDAVAWRGDGETLLVQAWGSDSVRVRSRLMGDVLDTDYALLRPAPADAAVDVDGDVAVLEL